MSTIRDVTETGEIKIPEPEKPLVSENNISAPVVPELEINAIAEHFNIDHKEAIKYADSVQTLLEWAKRQTTDYSLSNLKMIIRDLELKIGTPPLSEKKINYMARYCFLDQQDRKIRKEMEQFTWEH